MLLAHYLLKKDNKDEYFIWRVKRSIVIMLETACGLLVAAETTMKVNTS